MLFAPIIRNRALATGLRSLDRDFERFANAHFFAPSGAASRACEVQATDDGWTITLDLPGVAREELDIAVESRVVRIATQEQARRPVKAAWELPQDIDAAASKARLENGVLTLSLARVKPQSSATRIAVE